MKFSAGESQTITFGRQEYPRLIVFVDAEEEFQWHTYSPDVRSVRNILLQPRAQEILDRFGIKPTYLVDYPVASQVEGYETLRRIAEEGRCTIGAQLHP